MFPAARVSGCACMCAYEPRVRVPYERVVYTCTYARLRVCVSVHIITRYNGYLFSVMPVDTLSN